MNDGGELRYVSCSLSSAWPGTGCHGDSPASIVYLTHASPLPPPPGDKPPLVPGLGMQVNEHCAAACS